MVSKMEMDEDYKKRILNEIKKSGFPVELNVVEKLRRNNYLTFPNLTFVDGQKDLHEIDVLAMLVGGDQSWQYGMIGVSLIIECKQSKEKPWVFFEEVYDPITAIGLVPKLSCVSDLAVDYPVNSLLLGSANSSLHKHHYEQNIPIARTFFEAFKNQDYKSDIYKALTSVLYAHTYFKEWFRLSDKTNKENKMKRSTIIHPIIILEGDLIVAKKTKDSFSLHSVNHLFLRTIDNITNPSKSFFPTDNEIIIDVIKYSYLSSYLKICNKDYLAFKEHLLELDKNEKFLK
jgi:hypothetical protein